MFNNRSFDEKKRQRGAREEKKVKKRGKKTQKIKLSPLWTKAIQETSYEDVWDEWKMKVRDQLLKLKWWWYLASRSWTLILLTISWGVWEEGTPEFLHRSDSGAAIQLEGAAKSLSWRYIPVASVFCYFIFLFAWLRGIDKNWVKENTPHTHTTHRLDLPLQFEYIYVSPYIFFIMEKQQLVQEQKRWR